MGLDVFKSLKILTLANVLDGERLKSRAIDFFATFLWKYQGDNMLEKRKNIAPYVSRLSNKDTFKAFTYLLVNVQICRL